MKPISSENYMVRPFNTYKKQEFSIEYLAASSNNFSVYRADKPPVSWVRAGNIGSPIPGTNGRLFRFTMYQSIINQLYRNIEPVGAAFNPFELDSLYVISINQQTFGEKVRRGTFRLKVAPSENYLSDDSNGKVLFNGDPNHHVGDIFYEMGIVIIANSGTIDDIIELYLVESTPGSGIYVFSTLGPAQAFFISDGDFIYLDSDATEGMIILSIDGSISII